MIEEAMKELMSKLQTRINGSTISDMRLFMPYFYQEYVKLKEEYRRLRQKLGKDELTGVLTKGSLYVLLDEQLKIAADHPEQKTSVIMADIDDFKLYNDTYGHLQGDSALMAVANAMRDSVRPADVIARYGGEEFTILLPQTDNEQAEKVAEKIRSRVENTVIPAEKCVVPKAENYKTRTMSLGLFTYSIGLNEVLRAQSNGDFNLVDAVLNAADIALYNAKNKRGKNCLVVYEPGMSIPEG